MAGAIILRIYLRLAGLYPRGRNFKIQLISVQYENCSGTTELSYREF
jgi:hypothetical protein